MREVVKNYGPFFEFWWDGANGEGPNGKKQNYDWRAYEQTLRNIAPQSIIFSDIGPDARWAGNEKGFAGETNWNLLDTVGFKRGEGAPSTDTLQQGNVFGKNWIPAECDVSIRPGWFYHANEDSLVKTPNELLNLYLKSVGRGANLLLNVPPDERGLINEKDSAALMGFKKLRDESFAKNVLEHALFSFNENAIDYKNTLLGDHDENTFIKPGIGNDSGFTYTFSKPEMLNCIELQEPIRNGQRVKSFSIFLKLIDGNIKEIKGTTIGHKRMLTFSKAMVQSFSVVIHSSKGEPLISEMKAYIIHD